MQGSGVADGKNAKLVHLNCS